MVLCYKCDRLLMIIIIEIHRNLSKEVDLLLKCNHLHLRWIFKHFSQKKVEALSRYIMSCENVFKLEITLQKLSSTAIALQCWNLPNVQEKLQEYFDINETERPISKWREVVDTAIGNVNLLNFPEVLLSDIRSYIPLIGDTVFNWNIFVIRDKEFDSKYAQKIYWTSHGTIDELKIINEYWLKETEFSDPNNTCYLNKPLFTIATLYAQEHFIRDNMDRMKEELNILVPKGQRNISWTVYGVLSAWLVFCLSENKEDALNCLKHLKQKPNYLPAKELFLKSVKCGHRFVAKYFWGKLNARDKQESAVQAADEYLDNYRGYRVNQIEMLIFLINEMSVIQSLDFLSENFVSLFKLFLKVWPYQELCLNLLNQNWEYDPSDINTLLKKMMNYLSCTKKQAQFKNKRAYRLIFEKLLQKTSKERKEKYFVRKNRNSFYELYKNLDVVGLSLILNDVDLKEHRVRMIANCEDILKNLVLNENYSDLNLLMNNAFSEEEKKLYKLKFNRLTFFLTSGEFKSVDDHLNWLYDSEKDRLAAKEEIDSVKILVSFFKKNRIDLAHEFLLWRFDSEEERKSVKKCLIESNEFLRNEIYKIWCTRNPAKKVSFVEEKCSELLQWFLESDEAVAEFKKTKLIENEFFVVKYWKNLFYNESFDDVDKFLEFCLWTPKEIEELKRKIANNITWWIDTFLLNKVRMVNSLLKLIFKDKRSRKQIIADYIQSPKGALLCINVLKKYTNFRKPVIQFFNFWFDKSLTTVSISEMKKNLESFDETDGMKSQILTFLSNRKKGKIIKLSDWPRKVSDFDYYRTEESSDSESSDEYNVDEDDSSSFDYYSDSDDEVETDKDSDDDFDDDGDDYPRKPVRKQLATRAARKSAPSCG